MCGDLEDFCADDSDSLKSKVEIYDVKDIFATV